MGEDGRVPPLSRRVPGATDRDRPNPAPRVTPRKLPESLLQRMQAAIDAAPERAARLAPSASLRAPISGPEDVTQPIPVISGSVSRAILSPAAGQISAQPEPAVDFEPEYQPQPAAEPEPGPAAEPEPELAVAPEPEPAAEPEPEPEPESEPELVVAPEPELAVAPEPELAVAPEPEPAVAPESEPEPVAELELAVAPEPTAELELAVAPEPEPVAEPEPGSVVAPEREPAVELEPALEIPAERPARQQVPERKAPSSRRHRLAVVFASVIILATIGSLAFALSRHAATARGSHRGSASPVAIARAPTSNLAAAWVIAQVSRAVVVSCDPVTCRALEGNGIPSSDLLELKSGTADPRRSKVIVVTRAIRREFGGRLSSVYAPAVLARFGSGNRRIEIRAIAPHGAAAYESAISADLRARIAARTLLLGSDRIMVPDSARKQLSAGQVDSRLLITIANMATVHPLRIVAFGDSGPGASADIPLRSAELAELDGKPGTSSSAFIQSMLAYLHTESPRYRPAHTEVVRLDGQTVLRVEFAAPSPLGLISPHNG